MSDWSYISILSTVADVASLFSLGVSGYAAYAITKIRTQIVDRIRLPAIVATLESRAQSLAKLMATYEENETKETVLLELTLCETNLALVATKVKRPIKSRVRFVLKEIKKYKHARWFGYYPAVATREQAWIIYSELNGLISQINNLVEETKMGA